jgi:hypothetical protein
MRALVRATWAVLQVYNLYFIPDVRKMDALGDIVVANGAVTGTYKACRIAESKVRQNNWTIPTPPAV